MKPLSKRDAVKHFRSLWAGKPEERVGVRIIKFVEKNVKANYLPVAKFIEAGKAHDSETTHVVINVLSYLAGSDLHLLNMRFELIEDGVVTQLETAEVSAATKEKINPITGQADADLATKIFPFFVPSESALEIFSR